MTKANSSSMGKLALCLVHGTWASKSNWIDGNSLLSTELTKRLGIQDQIAFRWSGRNRFYERRKAQSELVGALSAAADTQNEILICSHSHGGGVVAYALQRPEIRRHILAAVFLSTPFFILRVLPSWRTLLNGLLAPIPLAFAIMLANIIFQISLLVLADKYPWSFGSTYQLEAIIVIATISWIALIGSVTLLVFFGRFEQKLARRALRQASELVSALSCDLPSETNALFVRTSGDEAAAALSVVQTASWLLLLVNEVFSKLFSWITRPFRIKRIRRPALLIILTAVICIFHAACMVEFFGRFAPFKAGDDLVPTALRIADAYRWAWFNSQLFGNYFGLVALAYLAVLVIAFWGILTILLFMFIVALFAFVCNWIVSSAFGRMPFIRGGLVQVAVEMVPPGDWQVIHTSWSSGAGRSTSLLSRHSHPYNDPKVVERIAQWIESIIDSERKR